MATTEIKSKWSDKSNTPAADIPLKEEVTAAQNGQDNFILPLKEKQEPKSRRVNAVFRPSIYNKFAQIAKTKGYSANELLNILIEDFVVRQEQQG